MRDLLLDIFTVPDDLEMSLFRLALTDVDSSSVANSCCSDYGKQGE
jgi:hypothetical protein